MPLNVKSCRDQRTPSSNKVTDSISTSPGPNLASNKDLAIAATRKATVTEKIDLISTHENREASMASQGPKPHFGNSRTWVSVDAMIQQKWYGLEPNLVRMFPMDKPAARRCPYIPRTLRDYVGHRSEYGDLVLQKNKRQLESREEDIKALQKVVSVMSLPNGRKIVWDPRSVIAFNGKVLEFGCFDNEEKKYEYPDDYEPVVCDPANRTAVLALQSIWIVADRHRGPWREEADWPSMQEMKWEGSQRISTEDGRFGRFLAVPRVKALPGASWSVMPFQKQYPFDAVWPVPDIEAIYAPVEDIDDDAVPKLLNQSLLNAINIKDDEM